MKLALVSILSILTVLNIAADQGINISFRFIEPVI
jgi:hypothetical protein